MRYLLNSAVITAPGHYEYHLLTVAEARAWVMAGEYLSTIGYVETAEAMTELLDVPVAVNRTIITMAPREEALVFRLALPSGSPRIAPGNKGALGKALLNRHYELGLLTRLI